MMFFFGFIFGFLVGYFFEIRKDKIENIKKSIKRNKIAIISPKTQTQKKVEDRIKENNKKGIATPIEDIYED